MDVVALAPATAGGIAGDLAATLNAPTTIAVHGGSLSRPAHNRPAETDAAATASATSAAADAHSSGDVRK